MLRVMGREQRKREHALPRFPFHCYTNPYEATASERVTDFCWGIVIEAIDPSPDELTSPIVQAADSLCQNILTYEGYFPLPTINFERQLSLGEIWDATKL